MFRFFLVFLFTFTFTLGLNYFGASYFGDLLTCVRVSLSTMFFVAGMAHFGKHRAQLIQMIPPSFPKAEKIVFFAGVLLIAGAIGMVIPITQIWAAACLAILVVSFLPANIRAAELKLLFLGKPSPSLLTTTLFLLVLCFLLLIVA
ncbi:DoxX family protein [Aureibacillus halotolerans]|uniref:Putative membrane protein n=1 Tax=Aureibacillus halotolerans TaxID=1508390 RepID=A0A4R6U9Z5_9BACI|nr:DoxX family protein [Aureibacillus halotolerans]TDQ42646.1 putative membrane protein [Aureibacillus halotolerans]